MGIHHTSNLPPPSPMALVSSGYSAGYATSHLPPVRLEATNMLSLYLLHLTSLNRSHTTAHLGASA